MTTIPVSQIINIVPNVLAAGGASLDLNGLFLTTSARVPVGAVQSFSDADAVDDYFGPTSSEASIAGVYFAGFDNSLAKPGAILFAQYPIANVPAYLRGGNISGLTLAQLQALSGTLGIVIDGSLKQGSVNLAGAASFSNAGVLVADALSIRGPSVATFTGSIAGTTLTVSAVASGTLDVGQVISGTGVVATTYISALASGTGGTGTYTVSDTQTALSQAMTAYAPAVQYDSISGAFVVYSGTTGPASSIAFGSGAMATSLLLTQATGAVLSQGTGATTPGAFMDAVTVVTEDWATFTTLFDPDTSGHTNKLAFAAWANGEGDRYAYVGWDTDAAPITTVPATASFGYAVDQASYSGTFVLYAPDAASGAGDAAFVCGIAASIDFTATNGRTTFAFRKQSGLLASVTDGQIAINLGGDPQSTGRGNGYNFYGAYGTANDEFIWLQRGFVSGRFLWMDSFVNQIWLNNAFQLAIATFLSNALSVPYNAAGKAQIESALADPINAGLNFGAFRSGVTLSQSQRASVNAQAGLDIAGTLETRGWYLQVGTATAEVRAARASPPCKFFYTDGQSVQAINLASIAVQ